jgi:two-component system, NtrC family, sensor histidine kinase HydH
MVVGLLLLGVCGPVTGLLTGYLVSRLRNPLMAMNLLVQSAPNRPGGPVLAGRDLAVLDEELARLERLTTTLVDFARPPLPEKQIFEAGALVEGCVDLVSSQAAQRDIRIDCDLPEEPVWAEADAGQFRQVVLNLLLNALEAVQEGGAVRVRLDEGPAPGPRGGGARWLGVRVEDTGPGLPDGLGQDIFAPFVSTKPTGLGLGLSICKRITEAHGGEVSAANRPEGGPRFPSGCPAAARPTNPPRPRSGRPPSFWRVRWVESSRPTARRTRLTVGCQSARQGMCTYALSRNARPSP